MRRCAQFSALVPSTAGFERLSPAATAICRCPSRSKARSCPRKPQDLANIGLVDLAHPAPPLTNV
jgi:hypothetical protein